MMKFFKLCCLPAVIMLAASCGDSGTKVVISLDNTENKPKTQTELTLEKTILECRAGVIEKVTGLDKDSVIEEGKEYLDRNDQAGASNFFMEKHPDLFFIAEMVRTGVKCDDFKGKTLKQYVSHPVNQKWLKSYLEMNMMQLHDLEEATAKGKNLSKEISILKKLIGVNMEMINEKIDPDQLHKKVVYTREVEKPVHRLVSDLRKCIYRYGGISECDKGQVPDVMNWNRFRTEYVSSIDVITIKQGNYIVRANTTGKEFGDNADMILEMFMAGPDVDYRISPSSGCLAKGLCEEHHFK